MIKFMTGLRRQFSTEPKARRHLLLDLADKHREMVTKLAVTVESLFPGATLAFATDPAPSLQNRFSNVSGDALKSVEALESGGYSVVSAYHAFDAEVRYVMENVVRQVAAARGAPLFDFEHMFRLLPQSLVRPWMRCSHLF
jgi:hypothetical protein